MRMNDKAESPIEVMFVIMLAIIVMVALTLIVGPFVDKFIAQIQFLQPSFIPVGSWGEGMLNTLVYGYAKYIFYIPTFIVLVVVIWGIKSMVKRHVYSTQQQAEIMSSEFD